MASPFSDVPRSNPVTRRTGNRLPLPLPHALFLVLALIIILVGLLLVVGGTFLAAGGFGESRVQHVTAVLLENDSGEPPLRWLVRCHSELLRSGVTVTKVSIGPEFPAAFAVDFPRNVPRGVFLPWLPQGLEMNRAEARLWFIRTETQPVEGPWVTQAEIERTEVRIPTSLRVLSGLENYPGTNVIIDLDTATVPARPLGRGETLMFEMEIDLVDKGFEHFWHRFAEGEVSTSFSLSASTSERRLFAIERRTLGGRTLPGHYLNVGQQHLERVSKVEYRWRSQLAGHFTSPESMIGAKQYWDEAGQRVEGRFVFRTNGSPGFLYCAAALGASVLGGGFGLLRKAWARAARVMRGPRRAEVGAGRRPRWKARTRGRYR